jgi:hypothetical protein
MEKVPWMVSQRRPQNWPTTIKSSLSSALPRAFGLIAKGLRALGNNKPITINAITSLDEIMAICGTAAANDILTVAFSPLAKSNPPLVNEIYKKAGSKPPLGLNTACSF